MISNFFRIAFRNIWKHKVFTFINITGLAIGLCSALLIILWIQNELSFDKFNTNAADIYRVEEDQFYSGERYHVTVTPHPCGPAWKEGIPEIKEQTRVNRLPRFLFRSEDKVFFESSVIAADTGIFKIFTLPFESGDPAVALRDPHSIVITKELAEKYFGSENPVGKTLNVENKHEFTVTGVLKNLPGNSMFRFKAIIPYTFMREIGFYSDSWGSNSILTFVLLEKGSDISAVNKKMTDIVIEHAPQITTKYVLFPLEDIHLHTQFGFREDNTAVLVVRVFVLIALFIILIACINFVNLSTAKSSTRAKEIGIRKVAGAPQSSMTARFMFESFLLVSMAMFLAMLLAGLLLGTFNRISGTRFVLADLFQVRFLVSFLFTGLLAGLLSGIYPAFYLSSIKPVAVLKGETVQGKGNIRLRKILVVLQFTLSILIAITAIFMFLQLKYLQNKDLGFDKENIINIPMSDKMKGRYYALKGDLASEPLILGVTASLRNPVMIGSNSGGASWDGKDPEKQVLIGTNAIDYDYLSTMRMELVSGRDFSREFPGDMAADTTGNFLVNEEVVKIMDIGDPVGKNFSFMGLQGTIVGVLKNFHFKGADQAIEPIAFALADTNYMNNVLVRLTPGKTKESLKAVETAWNKILPEYPLEYSFVDQDYEDQFRNQMRLTELLKYFTLLTLIIASLGLYGLSSFSAERRTNEIGIRKVMGASAASVIFTMTREYLWLVLLSLFIAIPAGWIIAGKLLKLFPYRIEINGFVFIIISAGALLLALLTVGYQAYRATQVNPAEALKIE